MSRDDHFLAEVVGDTGKVSCYFYTAFLVFYVVLRDLVGIYTLLSSSVLRGREM